MNLRYHVELTETERSELNRMLAGGNHPARKLKRVQILLAADAGSAARPSTAPSGALSKMDWRQPFARHRGREPGASSPARKRRF